MNNESGKLIKSIGVEYSIFTDFDLQEIIDEYNKDNETEYKLEDIEDYWIKYNILHLNINDIEIQYEGILGEPDCKRPNEIYFNNF